jgi:hypothetical protein
MIVEKSNDIEQFGSLKGESVAMGFAADATGHLMDVLAKNLYSRPKEAALREYSTNALDAQIEIGETRPFEVTLPTSFNPVLTIRDFGVGLDMEGIRKVYSQYGASTKRDSNDFNGTLGLGGKSAFAYSNRFTVVSIKNGVRIEVAVTRNEDGTADMVVVDERLSDEPRGTTIKIPTKRGDDFRSEAAKLYKWFPKGSVLVDGHQPEHFDPKAEGTLEIAPGMYVVKTAYRYGQANSDVVVMGNIAYPTDALDSGLDNSKHYLVVFVPNGSVQFAPSREALLMNGHTRKKLDELRETFHKAMVDTLQKHINAAPTKWDAADVVARWKEIVPTSVIPAGGWEYKGQPIPQKLVLDPQQPNARILPAEKRGYHNSHDKKREVGMSRFKSALWVEGFFPDQVTASHAQKARKYIADNNLSVTNGIVLIGAIPSDIRPWIQHIITYNDLKAVKLPRDNVQSTRSGRIPGSYDLVTTELSVRQAHWGQRFDPTSARYAQVSIPGVAAEEFRHWKSPLFYTAGNTYESGHILAALDAMQGAAGFTLVCMRSDRTAKFQRNFPAARDARTAIRDGFDRWKRAIGSEKMLAMAIQRSYYEVAQYRVLDASAIHDPELAKYVRLSKMDVSSLQATAEGYQRVLVEVNGLPEVIDFSNSDLYPLMSNSASDAAHTTVYVNAVYDARQAGVKL